MAAAQHKGDVTFTGAVNLADADVTMPTAALTDEDNVDWTGDHSFAGAVDLSAATVTLAAGEIGVADLASSSVTPVKIAAASVAPAANAACAILATTTEILLTISDATNTAISTTAAEPGQRIMLRVAAASGGGSYTLAVTTGTLTLNSVGETAFIQRNVADDAWFVVALTAGNAGGAAATIV